MTEPINFRLLIANVTNQSFNKRGKLCRFNHHKPNIASWVEVTRSRLREFLRRLILPCCALNHRSVVPTLTSSKSKSLDLLGQNTMQFRKRHQSHFRPH